MQGNLSICFCNNKKRICCNSQFHYGVIVSILEQLYFHVGMFEVTRPVQYKPADLKNVVISMEGGGTEIDAQACNVSYAFGSGLLPFTSKHLIARKEKEKICFSNYTRLTIILDMTISTKQKMSPTTLFLQSFARFSSLLFTPIVMMSPLFFQRYCNSSTSLQRESRCVSVNHPMKQMWLHTGHRQTAYLLYG